MAQVDFSNAVLEPNPDIANYYPLTQPFLYINTSSFIRDASDNSNITSGLVVTTIDNTPTKRSYSFTGVFTAGGVAFKIRTAQQSYWRVSNISFSENDTFSFIIEETVSVV